MLQVYRKLYLLLDRREKRLAGFVLLLLVMVAFFQVLGVASVLPFIGVLANPDVIENNQYLSKVYLALNFASQESFLFFLGLVFFGLFMGSQLLQAVGAWAQLRFSYHRNYEWSARLVSGYLRQPYEWFLNKHSADLAAAVLAEVDQVVRDALVPGMRAIANTFVAAFLLTLLFIVDPLLALGMGFILGGGFALISVLLRRWLKRIGIERKQANHARYHVVQEAFAGIKDVKIAGLERSLVRRFRRPSIIMAHRKVSAGLIRELPTIFMQGMLFGGMLLALLYLMTSYGALENALPIIALYALAGYRLMPALQNIYMDISHMRFSQAAVDALDSDLASLRFVGFGGKSAELKRISCTNEIRLTNVSYRYPGAQGPALNLLTLLIQARTTIGIVGSTGSGKTTLVDVVLGLLRPTEGKLIVDGIDITDELVRPWQKSLGYVPQQIFLSDDTVAGNIAFGLSAEEMDQAAVERAARIANLHEFVTRELPEGYETRVGERGVRLSGGQRQRIGIARALYHNPDVLILDEATSALDNVTERAVMEAVHALGKRKTIILIAHRLSTVKECDRIFFLAKGGLVASGTYYELVAQDEQFRAMAEMA